MTATSNVQQHPRAAEAETLMKDRNTVLGHEARLWEGDLGDLVDMSSVASTIIEVVIDGGKDPQSSMPNVFYLNDSQISQMKFAAFHLEAMIRAFRDKFYVAVER